MEESQSLLSVSYEDHYHWRNGIEFATRDCPTPPPRSITVLCPICGQEEQYDEIQLLRYRAADLRDDNQLLRAQLAKCREELGKRCRETEKRLEDAAAKVRSRTGSWAEWEGYSA